jgi:hypothetical protein
VLVVPRNSKGKVSRCGRVRSGPQEIVYMQHGGDVSLAKLHNGGVRRCGEKGVCGRLSGSVDTRGSASRSTALACRM